MSHQAAQERNRRLKKLTEETNGNYCSGAYYDQEKRRYVKFSSHNKGIKKLCRRQTRRKLKKSSLQHAGYKRVYDYFWQIS